MALGGGVSGARGVGDEGKGLADEEGDPGWKLDDLELAPQGVIWQALNIDYPGHSYSHLGIYYGSATRAVFLIA